MTADTEQQTVTVQSLATEAYQKLNKSKNKRPDGSEFLVFDDGRPKWMQDLAHEAHGDMMPDDWKYQFIHDALCALSEEEDEDAARDSLEIPCYYAQQLAWFASHMDRPGYVDESREQGGQAKSVMVDVACGMAMEQTEVFGLVYEFLHERAEAIA